MTVPLQPHQTQQERRDRTRARLIEATIRSIADHGYPATTTRRIAELSDTSLGALAHHFPARVDLIATAMGEVAYRMGVDLHTAAKSALTTSDKPTAALLDVLWSLFHNQTFTIWVKVWIAAADDPELYAAVAPVDATINRAFAELAADIAPADLSRAAWNTRISATLDAMRGLALTLAVQPRKATSRRDPWPNLRSELIALVER